MGKAEGCFAVGNGFAGGGNLGSGVFGIERNLLNLFVKIFAGKVETILLTVLLNLNIADIVAIIKPAENRNVEVETDILVKIVINLFAKRFARHIRRIVIIGAHSAAEGQCGVICALGYL